MRKELIIVLVSVILLIAASIVACQKAATPVGIPTTPGFLPGTATPIQIATATPISPSSTTNPSPPDSKTVAALDFTLPALDGTNLTLSELKGRPVLVNFWATWCPPCREEMPLIQAIYEEKKSEGLIVLAIDIGEENSVVKKFMEEQKLTFTVLMDHNRRVAAAYGVRAIPTSFFIDTNGYIKAVKIGAFISRAEITGWLKNIMPA